MSSNSYLIRSAQAVLTGERGDAARSDATDPAVGDGTITEMGRGLQPAPSERVTDAPDCVI